MALKSDRNGCRADVLLMHHTLSTRTGAELYVSELGEALHNAGHSIGFMAVSQGSLAAELRSRGFAMNRSPLWVAPPRVIIANSALDAALAMRFFPLSALVFICHNHAPGLSQIGPFEAIDRYLAVSTVCEQSLVDAGVPLSRVARTRNFVDLQRFVSKKAPPDRLRKAVIFSNYATETNYVPAVRHACLQRGITLDVIGLGMGTSVSAPETVLNTYDLAFCKARAAIEALASGCAVVLCDFAGVGPLVTSTRIRELSTMNFGAEALTGPHEAGFIGSQIDRYDPQDLRLVTKLVRETHGLEMITSDWVSLLHSLPDRLAPQPLGLPTKAEITVYFEFFLLSIGRLVATLPSPIHRFIRKCYHSVRNHQQGIL
jgi:hypothetical protein